MILGELGQNLTIKDRKLSITGDTPFYIVENGKQEMLEIMKRLEPGKDPYLQALTEVPDNFVTSWQGWKDSNLRERFWRPPSYR